MVAVPTGRSLAAGDLVKRVTVRAATEAPNAAGEPVKTWAAQPEAVVWGAVQDTGGRELFFAQQTNSEVTAVITLRPYPGLGPAKRLEVGGRVYNIDHVMEGDHTKRFMKVACVEEKH